MFYEITFLKPLQNYAIFYNVQQELKKNFLNYGLVIHF